MRIDHRTVGVFEENCYLLADDETSRGVLIDPGDEAGRIVAMVEDAGVALDAIWLTHAHIDHIGAVAAVKRRFDVPVYLHPMDLPYYTRLSALAADMYGIDFEQPEVPEESLSDSQRLRCGALEFEVMHVPGISFGGDLLFAGSIGRTDLPLGSAADMNASLARYTSALPDETTVYPGHGPATTIEREKRTNPFLLGAARLISR